MQSKTSKFCLTVALSFTLALLTALPLAAGTFNILHRFNGKNGAYPSGSLIMDAQGNLYGTSSAGGAHNGGNVFQLVPGANREWTVNILYSFCSATNCADGQEPLANLIFDTAGNLYGTTAHGGTIEGNCNPGCGTVFQLTPNGNGAWTEKVLHNFCSGNGYQCSDGAAPNGGLIFDADGNLYGTTVAGLGGTQYSYGTVFELSPGANGNWTETILYGFKGGRKDGANPASSLVFDASGNLYGTTPAGGLQLCGKQGCGTVFQLTPGANGVWTENILTFFKGYNGNGPSGSLIFDSAGNLFGVTQDGGDANPQQCPNRLSQGCGVVFKLTPGTNGNWSETVVHRFYQQPKAPEGNLIFDTAGHLYGTTSSGGPDGVGIVYELSPSVNGTWTETVFHSFTGSTGYSPTAGLLLDAAGNLYGTARLGGFGCPGNGCGTIFEITP